MLRKDGLSKLLTILVLFPFLSLPLQCEPKTNKAVAPGGTATIRATAVPQEMPGTAASLGAAQPGSLLTVDDELAPSIEPDHVPWPDLATEQGSHCVPVMLVSYTKLLSAAADTTACPAENVGAISAA